MRKLRILISCLVAVAIVYGAWIAFKWTVMRVYVGPDQALMVIKKFGDDLTADLLAVPADQQRFRGVQAQLLGPGRYFIDPIRFDTRHVDLVSISAGDPLRWDWDASGKLMDVRSAPQIGLVTARQGKTPPPDREVVEAGYKGIQRDVLTPGVYKINPQLYEVKKVPAQIVPPGSVGVVTMRVGDVGEVTSAPLTTEPATRATRLVTGAQQRGILKDVLQPGIYYVNPYLVKVDVMPVGYDAISLVAREKTQVGFYSSDGYQVEADFTVVWGRSPADAPTIMAMIGDTDRVEENVIQPAMKAACQNVGATFTARELIQGTTRSKFQDDLERSLEDQVKSRNVHILSANIRNITILDARGQQATEGLLATIQRANIEVENELTNKQKTLTATISAKLDQAQKDIEVARETVTSETNIKVANILADAQKKAAEIDAQRDMEIANTDLQIAQLDAQRTQILGKAKADVERLKNEAEAKGARLLVEALGSPGAYNSYIFAKNFDPADIRLIVTGPGTFWTDLKTFEHVGAAKMLQPKPATMPGQR